MTFAIGTEAQAEVQLVMHNRTRASYQQFEAPFVLEPVELLTSRGSRVPVKVVEFELLSGGFFPHSRTVIEFDDTPQNTAALIGEFSGQLEI